MNWMLQVERYVTLKRQSGYKFFAEEKILLAFARHATSLGDKHAKAGTIIEWAAQTASAHHAREKLALGRAFALWLRAEDERHEVPPRNFLGRNQRKRPNPHLLTPAHVQQLLDATLSLGPAGSITPHTFHHLFGLMASTGLRRSEAVSLRLTDITPDGLIIRETKFRKSRLVPLHESVREKLEAYLVIRGRVSTADDHLFVLSTGHPPCVSWVTKLFIRLCREIGVRGKRGEPGPRLHGLRHGFATRSVERVIQADRKSVDRHMLALSTYLGHSNLANTYWYLEATPVLLQTIADAAEKEHMRRICR